MPRAPGLLTKVNKILEQFNATDRTVLKRVYSITGGDPLTGRGGVTTKVDTPITPPPAISTPTASAEMFAAASSLAQIADYKMLVSYTALTRQDLENKAMVIVFASGASEEELTVTSFKPLVIEGQAIAYTVLLKSVKT